PVSLVSSRAEACVSDPPRPGTFSRSMFRPTAVTRWPASNRALTKAVPIPPVALVTSTSPMDSPSHTEFRAPDHGIPWMWAALVRPPRGRDCTSRAWARWFSHGVRRVARQLLVPVPAFRVANSPRLRCSGHGRLSCAPGAEGISRDLVQGDAVLRPENGPEVSPPACAAPCGGVRTDGFTWPRVGAGGGGGCPGPGGTRSEERR